MTSDRIRTRLVTVSAAYGAGGSVVAPALARRLGVPFLQRATTTEGGSNTDEPCAEALAQDEAELIPAHRLLTSLTSAATFGTAQSPLPSYPYDDELRRHCETGLRQLAEQDAGVIL
ncbi:MAG TPA: cytidylate kinase family protein, partial [Trebonia sp.]|nr:cytidylate kinase family protein [Trebonia sp.]